MTSFDVVPEGASLDAPPTPKASRAHRVRSAGSRSLATKRRKGVAILAVIATVGVSPLLLGPSTSSASSHREAPLIAGLPKYDNTDLYAFRSPENDGTVTLVSNWIPFEEPNGGPNFYPFATDALYDINIDNNGDGKADIVYRWTFASSYQNQNTFLYNTGQVTSLTDPDLNFRQLYNLRRYTIAPDGSHDGGRLVVDHGPVAPSDTGPASMPNYAALRQQAVLTRANTKSYAGQADDPFFADLRVFDLLYGGNKNHDGKFSEAGNDTLKHYNVNSVALKVPDWDLAYKGDATRNPVVGIWSTTIAKAADGTGAQVSRLGNPLVNEVVVPVQLKDAFNSLTPDKDHTIPAVVAKVKAPEVPMLVQAIYGIPAPTTPRDDLVETFLTGISTKSGPIHVDLNSQLLNKDVVASKFVPAEELRLNMKVASHANPNRLGVLGGDTQGYPNGRRLTDDVLDIELQALEGALPPYSRSLATLGDAVNANDVPFTSAFPYLGLPNAG